MNITLKQLQVFIYITQEKTITAAAIKLFQSKPAVSMALAELEKQLGHKLFERKNNRLLINELGKKLLPLADEQIMRSKEIGRLFSQPNELNGKLRIGASNTVGNQVLPPLLSDFRKHSKHLQQSLLIDNSTSISRQIKDYELDLGLVEENVFDPEIQSTRWLKDEMVIVAHRHHWLSKKQKVTLSDLENQAWIVRESGSGTRNYFLKKIVENLKHYHFVFTLNTSEAIINCTAEGLGIACISKLAARHALKDKRLVVIDLDLEMHRDYWIIWHKDKYQSPLLKKFIEFSQNWEFKI